MPGYGSMGRCSQPSWTVRTWLCWADLRGRRPNSPHGSLLRHQLWWDCPHGPTYDDVAAAHRQALQAADFGRRHGTPVTSFADISMPGVSGMLGREKALAFSESLLQPLIAHDRVGRGDLVVSLRTWLAHHGQWDPSAAALGVHRHTLRHRIRTAEELLGRSLDAPGTRSELWLALEVLDP